MGERLSNARVIARSKLTSAVTTGSGSPFTHTFGNLIPDVRNPPNSSSAVWVFALPER